MTSDSITPRMAAMVGALAFVPIAWYWLSGFGTAGIVASVNVVIILASMALATGPAEESNHHGAASA
jgi:hypothetical protein